MLSYLSHLALTNKKAKKSAFTLIELLVVIAIIAILASILFPVFARARENARRTSCMSNMKQFGLAWIQYAQDYDEFAVPMRTAVGGGNFSLRDVMDPYIKSKQIYVCPSDTQTQTGTGASPLLSYAYNWCVATNCAGAGGSSQFKNIAAIQLPTQTPAFIEGSATFQTTLTNYFTYVDNKTMYGRQTDSTSTGYKDTYGSGMPRTLAHLDGCNFMFADGHAKWFHNDGMINTKLGSVDLPFWMGKAGYTLASTSVPGPKKNDIDYNADGIVGSDALGWQ